MPLKSVTIEIDDIDRGLQKIFADLNIKEAFTTVGIHEKEGAETKESPDDRETDATVVDVAIDHEFGISVPQRSYVRSTFDENLNQYMNDLRAIASRVVSSRGTSLKSEFKNLGKKVEGQIVDRIEAHIDPPLRKRSIRRKEEFPGINVTTPLIWSGQMIDSIKHEVKVK